MIKEISPEQIERVKSLYAIIANRQLGSDPESLQARVDIIRELERITKQEFLSTADFHQKINSFILKRGSIRNDAVRFQTKRIELGLTQEELSRILGVSVRIIKHWEAGTRPLSKLGLSWLNSAKGEHKFDSEANRRG